MEFGILGPLEVRADGRAVDLGGPKPRGLIALLLLHAGQPLSPERISLALWGEDAPAGSAKTVQVHVSRLRRALGSRDALVTTRGGYMIPLAAGELDADRFASLVADGRNALDAGDAVRASSALHEALALWRGPPLGDLSSLPFAPPAVARLEEQHLEALELRIDADLAAGRHAELIAELVALVQEHVWRERLHAQLMLALYRSGRQADALDAYQRARAVLVEELGVEPGEELVALQREILAQTPGLAAPEAPDDGRRGALPGLPNRTVGRARELDVIAARLGACRMLTLTGAGGVGKTRLAVEAARAVAPEFAEGACFVALAPLAAADEVPMAIVRALGIVVRGEVAEAAIARFLTQRNFLLVLDNCEHVLGIAPFVGRLLEECPRLTVLATSREPLDLQAEERHPVPPLALTDARSLFADRARVHLPDVEFTGRESDAISEICRRVDGLPLAVELAAARSALLSPVEIAGRLDATFAALGTGPRDAPARHQTLRATIDWSHQLLSNEEQTCFARFAVFAGGATVEAAEAITGADLDTLDDLVTKSLLVRRRKPGGRSRLMMLETVRAYALERLADGADAPTIRERHHTYFRTLAERHGSDRALKGVDRREHLRVLDADIENVLAALTSALENGQTEAALAQCVALGEYWFMRDHHARAVELIERALHLPGADGHPRLRVLALCHIHLALSSAGRRDDQGAALEEAEAIARSLGDPQLLARALEARTFHLLMLDHMDLAKALVDEALVHARRTGDDWEYALAVAVKALVADTPDELRSDVDLAARLLEREGNVFELAGVLAASAFGALNLGCDREARAFVARAVDVARDLDNRYTWLRVQDSLGMTALLTGDITAADEAFREGLRLGRDLAVLTSEADCLEGLAAVAVADDDLDRAARLHGAAGAHRYGAPAYPVHDRLRTTVFEPARRRHGADAWDADVARGAAMSHDAALDYALAG